MESQVEEWCREVGELQAQAAALPAQAAGREEVGERQSAVGTRIVRLIEPLKERRRILLASKEVHQVSHELEDEVMWVQDRLPLATLKDHGTNLQTVQQLIKKNQNLRREIQARRPRVDEVLERAAAVACVESPEAEVARGLLGRLATAWAELQEQAERRQQALDASYQLQQYLFDVAEVEAWLGEQELLLMSEEKGKVAFGHLVSHRPPPSPTHPPTPPQDEQSTLQLLKKHLLTEQTIENYEETIAQLSRQCRALLELGHPQRSARPRPPPGPPAAAAPPPPGLTGAVSLRSEQVSRRQSQVDRLYVSLKELLEERKVQLEQQYWLYQLNREVDELEHWIAEKELVAGSPELGQDFEHVTVSAVRDGRRRAGRRPRWRSCGEVLTSGVVVRVLENFVETSWWFWHLLGGSGTSLVIWHHPGAPETILVVLTPSWWSWHLIGGPGTSWWSWHHPGGPDTILVVLVLSWVFWHLLMALAPPWWSWHLLVLLTPSWWSWHLLVVLAPSWWPWNLLVILKPFWWSWYYPGGHGTILVVLALLGGPGIILVALAPPWWSWHHPGVPSIILVPCLAVLPPSLPHPGAPVTILVVLLTPSWWPWHFLVLLAPPGDLGTILVVLAPSWCSWHLVVLLAPPGGPGHPLCALHGDPGGPGTILVALAPSWW
ncbi:Spectrin beta chain, non-erythrocytic 4 [Lonchura striata]|uniref:Spectrin beta chain, non-erythrocytic 4 n=1 Tax=Lonchura striata TaxID=40157 RepID=A0A218U7A2_9PASE|nr:Spectrin beta chain, non-erythrocytic 4 [Lonchura striata domestica]